MLVVAIGASAGGLEACQRLVDGLSPDADMAFVLVQHLDPTHKSMMVELLAHHTRLTVVQATDGARLERAHLYVIPPGTYLAVEDGAIRLSKPRPTARACRSTSCFNPWRVRPSSLSPVSSCRAPAPMAAWGSWR